MKGQTIVRGWDALYQKVGLRKTTVRTLIEKDEFPKPIKLGKVATGWLTSELEEWVSKRVSERDGSKG